ncbi:MAG: cytochrome P450 [Solirubrobacteraceae bacterium]|nr:cytochrome P450 [Solirubrobacteraceae bacterium]
MALPPGPGGPSLVVSAQFLRRPLDSLRRWQGEYGDAFTIRFTGFKPGVYVSDPQEIKALLTGDQSDLLAGEANSFLAPVLGPNSVLVLDGREHLRQRKLLLPPFQGSHITTFREIIRAAAEREVDRWRAGDRIVLRDRMRALTFDVISHAVFGVTEPARVERLRTALTAVIDVATAALLLPGLQTDLGPYSPGGRLKRRLAAADALILEEIRTRRAAPDLDERDDVLSLLLRARDEDGRAMSDDELRDELFTMLAAGHETTATGLAFTFEILLRNPEALARVRQAIEEEDDAYLDATAKESLRLRPVVDAAERTLTKPRTVAGYELPPGTMVFPAIALVHHRPDLYPEPDAFRPERFLDGGAESYAWLPFGGGIRRCIGAALAQAEMVEVLRVVAARTELHPRRSGPDPIVMRGVTLAPKHGVPVTVRRVLPTGVRPKTTAPAMREPATVA